MKSGPPEGIASTGGNLIIMSGVNYSTIRDAIPNNFYIFRRRDAENSDQVAAYYFTMQETTWVANNSIIGMQETPWMLNSPPEGCCKLFNLYFLVP